ncbi:MAG: hypothetical protein HQL35_12315 [Alphaproteobacteria bacterium]|nr:hypothetical protein [Alphaproteobacteria bacterium]
MIFRGFGINVFVIATLWSALAYAQDAAAPKALAIPNAEELIQHCWDISEEKRASGVTSVMREGHLDTALCLENEIIAHGSALLTTPPSKEDLQKLLETLRFTYGGLYWDMFNGNRGCNPSCGTLNHTRHNWELAKLYEKILGDIIELRKKYGV